jgi:hypothetical protein
MTDTAAGASGSAPPSGARAGDATTGPATDAAAVFPGDSEIAARCRALDWDATPLGPVATWPPARG